MSPIPYSHLPYSLLPFGNLHKRAASAFGSNTITPVKATNIITSPAGMDEDNATQSSSKTPLDMGAPAQSPADQSPTEQALGASADDLKMRDDHAKLQAEHQKLQQQADTMKQQAQIAKQQAALKAAPAAPKNDSMGKYKSMSMQLMGAHLDRVKQNLKGLSEGAGGLPMQLKLACAFQSIKLFEKAAAGPPNHTWAAPPRFVGPPSPATFHPRDMSNAPASSLSADPKHNVLADAGSGTMPHTIGAGNIAETSDQAQRLSRLTAGPAPGGLLDHAATGAGWLFNHASPFGMVNHLINGPQPNRFDHLVNDASHSLAGVAPAVARTTGAAIGNAFGNQESQKDMNALTSTMTPGLDTAQGIASQPTQAAAPINLNVMRGLDPVARQQAMQTYGANLTEPQRLQMESTHGIGDAADTYADHPGYAALQKPLSDAANYYAGAPGSKAAPGVGPWEQQARKLLDTGTAYGSSMIQNVAGGAGDAFRSTGEDLSEARLLPGQDSLGRHYSGALLNAGTGVLNVAQGVDDVLPFGGGLAAKGVGAAGKALSLGHVMRNGVGAFNVASSTANQQDRNARAGQPQRLDQLAGLNTQMNATKGVKNPNGQYVGHSTDPYATAYGQQSHAEAPATSYQNPGFWGWLMSQLGQGQQLPQGVPQQAYQPSYFDTAHTYTPPA